MRAEVLLSMLLYNAISQYHVAGAVAAAVKTLDV
jgi:hypothetical protein